MVNWITVSSSSGNSGSTVVTVTASSYSELTARTTSLTVRTVNSNLSANVNITQEPKEIITVTVSPTSISAPVSGGTYTFNIASNGAWTITYPSWLQVSQTSGTGNATITVTIPENESYSALTGNIVVSTADNTATVSVSQAAAEEPSRISVSPTTIQNIVSGGSAYTLTVTSNTGWTIDGPSWVRYSTLRGSGDTTVNITVVPNSSSARTDNIVFTTTDSAATATVSLSQAGQVMPVGSTEYLTIECKTVISGRQPTLYFNHTTSGTPKTILYSLDGTSWNTVTSSASGGTLIATLSAGDKVYLQGYNDNYKYHNFIANFTFDVYGNILSLVDGEIFSTLYDIPTNSCFAGLFQGQYLLKNAEDLVLQATGLTEGCYQGMFISCSSLLTAPELPATVLANNCYNQMFSDCEDLTTAPVLPATALTEGCYDGMFQYCRSLTTAPELPATTLAPICYNLMFDGCSNLNYIKCLATDISATGCTNQWVQNVPSTGTFVKNASMTSWSTGVSGIPNGWTVQDAS